MIDVTVVINLLLISGPRVQRSLMDVDCRRWPWLGFWGIIDAQVV